MDTTNTATPTAARVWRPTKAERDAIRQACRHAAGCANPRIEAGLRFPLSGRDGPVSEWLLNHHGLDPDQSDLADHVRWRDIREVPLIDGCAVLDLYVYSSGRDGELEDNVIVFVRDGALVELRETHREGRVVWSAAG